MRQLTRTWWGQRFITALEKFTDPARLARGRTYARTRRIQSHTLRNGKVTAKVEGKINPYFGVYEIPIYTTSVQMTAISQAQWSKLIQRFAGQADIVSQLLMHVMPERIENIFTDLGLHLMPRDEHDFKTNCSCPDFYNPCKHIAGVCYFLAAQLDHDPFLLFELRGLSRDRLRQELAKTPLGKTLAKALTAEELAPQPVTSYYTRPNKTSPSTVDYDHFWNAEKRLPTTLEPLPPPGLPAVLIRKAGDYPAFWEKDQSFIEIMSEFYERVRKQHKALLP